MTLPTPIQTALDDMQNAIAGFDLASLGERKVNILKVFLRLAAAQDYAATTMRSIGRELDLKAPSIYSHFPGGKEDIISYSLRWQGSLYGDAMSRAVVGTDTPGAFFDALVRGHCLMNLENRENSLWDMIVSSDRIGRFLPDTLRAEMEQWLRLCAGLYEAPDRVLGVSYPEIKGRQILTIIDSVHSWADWDGSPEARDLIVERTVALCRAALHAP